MRTTVTRLRVAAATAAAARRGGAVGYHGLAGAHAVSASGLHGAPSVSLIGAPMSLGQPRAGTEKAPAALRASGMLESMKDLGYAVIDRGDAEIPMSGPNDPVVPKTGRNAFAVGTGNRAIAAMTEAAATEGHFVLTLGGDHSVAMGSIAGIMAARPNLGVIWVDAHADINLPETSPSGNIHGMPLAFLSRLVNPASIPGCEWLASARYPRLDPSRVVYVGLRDLDRPEQVTIRNLGMKAFTMSDVDRWGIGEVMERAVHHLTTSNGPCPLHLSFDIDACDPAAAPSTGTTVPGGLSFREAHYVCESVAATGLLGSMDLVEINPDLVPGAGAMATVQLGAHLALSAVGKNILPPLSKAELLRMEREAIARKLMS